MSYEKHKKIISFTDLTVWKKGHQLVLNIYKITKKFPKSESYILVDQMRRAVTSITSNIAEGFGRRTLKDRMRFYYQAQGSLTELKDQLLISKDLNYLEKEEFDLVARLANEVHQLLQGLIQKSKFISRSS